MSLRVILPSCYRAMPWRNGGGVTHEIAVEPPGADTFAWRASIAQVDGEAAFSAFPGVDRWLAPLPGADLALRGDGLDVVLPPGAPAVAFAGEARIVGTPIGDASRDFNLMVARATGRGRLVVAHAAMSVDAGSVVSLLHAARGTWRCRCDGSGPIDVPEGATLRVDGAPAGALRAVPVSGEGHAVLAAVDAA